MSEGNNGGHTIETGGWTPPNERVGSPSPAEQARAREYYTPVPRPEIIKQLRELRQNPKALAENVLTICRPQIGHYGYDLQSGEGRITYDGENPIDSKYLILMSYLLIPEKTLNRFIGHGITRTYSYREEFPHFDQLNALTAVLTTKQLIGDARQLGSDGYSAWTDGPFLLVSEIDNTLADWDPTNGNQTKLDIGAVVVNGQLEPTVDILRAIFPEVKFLTAWEFPDWANQQARKPKFLRRLGEMLGKRK